MSNADKWASLASNLGVSPPVDQSGSADAGNQTSAQAKPANPPVSSLPPAKPASPPPQRPKSNWNQLAGELGIDPGDLAPMPPAPAPVRSPSVPQRAETPSAPISPPSRPEPPPAFYRESRETQLEINIIRPGTSSGPAKDSSDSSGERHERSAASENDRSQAAAPRHPDSTGERESGEARGNRGRRRGGRGRGRGRGRERDPNRDTQRGETTHRGENAVNAADRAAANDESHDIDADADFARLEGTETGLPRSEHDLPEIAVPGVVEEAPREYRRRKRRRRGRGGKSEERGSDSTGARPAASEPSNGKRDASREVPRESLPAANQSQHDHDDDHDDHDHDDFESDHDDENGHDLDRGHRSVPSWADAVGVMVELNLEARSKHPSGGQQNYRGRGGRSRGGRGRREG